MIFDRIVCLFRRRPEPELGEEVGAAFVTPTFRTLQRRFGLHTTSGQAPGPDPNLPGGGSYHWRARDHDHPID